jgi:DeoR family transcriptional regulator, suf operon transcriptional repressor
MEYKREKMKSTRDRILQFLLSHTQSSINDLAKAVGINAISVRHHLTSLQADGLVRDEEQRHGVGRPRLVYSLTEEGLERFPTRYLRLSDNLLSQMKNSLSIETVKLIFREMALGMANEHKEKLSVLSLDKKLEFLKDFAIEQGFSIEWEKRDNKVFIFQSNCPYYHIGQDHPEVCIFDQTLISELLSCPVEMVSCYLNSEGPCTYIVTENSQV